MNSRILRGFIIPAIFIVLLAPGPRARANLLVLASVGNQGEPAYAFDSQSELGTAASVTVSDGVNPITLGTASAKITSPEFGGVELHVYAQAKTPHQGYTLSSGPPAEPGTKPHGGFSTSPIIATSTAEYHDTINFEFSPLAHSFGDLFLVGHIRLDGSSSVTEPGSAKLS